MQVLQNYLKKKSSMVWTNNTLFQGGLLQQAKMWMTALEKKKSKMRQYSGK